MEEQVWVEPIGSIIMARLRGAASEAMMQDCRDRVLTLVKDTHYRKVLYDGLEMDSVTVDLALIQQKFEAEMCGLQLRRALVVPNSRVAYLARLAFGEGDYRVFYNDMASAIKWLEE